MTISTNSKMRALVAAGIFGLMFLRLQAQGEFLQHHGTGVLLIRNVDSISLYDKPNGKGAGMSFWNFTGLPEHHQASFYTQFSIRSSASEGGWHEVIASPFMVDDEGLPLKDHPNAKFYVKADSNVEYFPWETFLVGKVIYQYSGSLFDDPKGEMKSDCDLRGCCSCQKIVGDWMEVQILDGDCSQFNEKPNCGEIKWLKWREESEFLVKLLPN